LPEYQHQWGSRILYTQLRLDPLGRNNAEEMLSSLLGDQPELAPLKRLLIERTEGNPFFMEEIVRGLPILNSNTANAPSSTASISASLSISTNYSTL
jgi:predicted ATPase